MNKGTKIQLLAQGAQNIILNGNAEITFFKTVYLKHTNFSIIETRQAFDNVPTMGEKSIVTIARSGDLLGYTYLETSFLLQEKDHSYFPAEQMISSVELLIGERQIDFYDTFGNVFHRELELKETEKLNYIKLTNIKGAQADYPPNKKANRSYLPLNFFFCQSPHKFLPIGALTHHEVKINIHFTTAPSGFGNIKTGVDELLSSIQTNPTVTNSGTVTHVKQDSTTGSGSGAEFTLVAAAPGGSITGITATKAGTTYRKGDLITINQSTIAATIFGTASSDLIIKLEAGDIDNKDWYVSNVYSLQNTELWCTYIYLDEYERRMFQVNKNEYLIEQHQFQRQLINPNRLDITKIRLPFKNAVKYLSWCYIPTSNDNRPYNQTAGSGDMTYGYLANNYIEYERSLNQAMINYPGKKISANTGDNTQVGVSPYYTSSNDRIADGVSTEQRRGFLYQELGNAPLRRATIWVNDKKLFQDREGDYFNVNQAYNYFKTNPQPGIYAYSFALRPNDSQPSGSLNFSLLPDVTLEIENGYNLTNYQVLVIYAKSYNILRIQDGMGGLAFPF